MGFWHWLFGIKPKTKRSSGKHFDAESRWIAFDVPYGGATRQPGTVLLKGGSDVNVAGTSFRIHDCHNFIVRLRELDKQGFGLPTIELIREPANPVSPASIMVLGTDPSGERYHLGYLPKDVAISITEEWRPELPLFAELRRYGRLKDGNEVFFSINILVPKAADRKPFVISP